MPIASTGVRRAHKKSRRGCKECKVRHRKCDEVHPSCLGCLATNRRCSFLDLLPSPPVSEKPLPLPSTHSSPPSCNSHDLELLHHAQSGMGLNVGMTEAHTMRMWDFIFGHALESPYFLDQLLALAAAHLSSLHPDRKDYFQQHASRLQTRSLTQLNNRHRHQDAHKESMALLLHSSMLGQHLLFDALRYPDESSVVIDKFISYLSIHRGVHAVLSDTSLQWSFAASEDQRNRFQSATAWPIILPAAFLDLLKQRRPEALVIVARYAVLMHYSRDIWIFGNGGRLLVRSISQYLGTFWAQWLVWPNEEISKDEGCGR
ncbi:hypothetical protein F4859DRAFT_505443 [Xylaria cf. heliscus]|nr:hypothetical protein F4859DRAFT_505443 [Xylaria cf. heliscus]